MSLCPNAIHLLPQGSRHLNCTRRSSKTLRNGKLTRSSAPSDTTGSSIIFYSGGVTVTYGLAQNVRRISGMRRKWSTSFTKNIRGSLDDDWSWRRGIRRFHRRFTWPTFLWISAQSKWCWHGFPPPPVTDQVEV